MQKKLSILVYILVISSLFTISYTGAHFTDLESSSNNLFNVSEIWSPPNSATHPDPGDDSKRLGLNTELSVYVSDPNYDIMNVSFFNANDDSLIDMVTDVDSETRVSVNWGDVEPGRTYAWYVITEDHEGSTKSETWKFTTNNPPDPPILIAPLNKTSGLGLTIDLKVKVTDPDGDSLDVLFYSSSNTLIERKNNTGNGSTVTGRWKGLSFKQKYRWYVLIDDGVMQTKSEVWNFITKPYDEQNKAPEKDKNVTVNNTNPVANASGPYNGRVLEDILFNGSSSYDPDGNITSYLWDFGDGQNGTNITSIHSYSEFGIYNLTLTVTDNQGATNTDTTIVTITGIQIKDIEANPNPQNIGEYVNISCNIISTNDLVDAILYLTYPDASEYNITLNQIENTTSYYYNQIYTLIGTYDFYIKATDIDNYTVTSETFQFQIIDNIPPEIANVTITPTSQTVNESVNISALVTDNVGIQSVSIYFENPDNTTTNHAMLQINGTNNYYYNSIYQNPGIYNFYIEAVDTSNNIQTSPTYSFNITQ